MKVMVIVKASKGSEAGEMPSQELLEAMGRFNEELVKAGILLDGAGLHPSSKGVRVHFSGTDRQVIDGPFAETKELIAGFWLWRVVSMNEAIEWVKRCPNPMKEDSDIEIRPLFEADDFGEVLTPEIREQEAAVMAKALGLDFPRFENAHDLIISGLNQHYTMETRIAIPQQWGQFMAESKKIDSGSASTFFGVSWNSKPSGEFEYLTGVETTDAAMLPSEMTSVKITARRYAVFPHTAHVSAMPKAFDTIFSKWVPECGLKIASAACFERYSPEFNACTGMGGMEIWIPLE